MKKTLCMLLAALLLLGCFAACGGETQPSAAPSTAPSTAPSGEPSAEPSGEPSTAPEGDPFADMDEITLIYSSTKNEMADVAQLEYLDAITEASGGKVVFDKYLSNSLISSTRDIPDGVASGIADIATLNINNYTGLFPLNHNIISIPFTGVTDAARLDVMNYMYDKYPELEQEFTDAGLKLLGWSTTNASNLGVKLGKEYTSIADIKNVKITGASETEIDIMAAAGAVPVTVAFPEIYQSLEKNVINGFVNHSAPAFSMSFHEHIDNWVVFGENSGMDTNLVAVCMGLDKWNELPEAVQNLFLEFEPQRAQKELETQMGFDVSLKETLEAEGKYYVVLNEEQLAEWEPIVEPIKDQIIVDMEASHPGFAAMYEDFCAQLETYK